MDTACTKRILMISRKHPPSIGGMQIYSKELISRISDRFDTDTIILGRGQWNLLWFMPYAFLKSLVLISIRKHDILYLCDGLLSPLGRVIKFLTGVKVIVTVHGLDVTYGRFLYQWIVPASIARLDKVICVSGNTRDECIKRGVREEICTVINNAVVIEDYRMDISRQEAIEELTKCIGGFIGGKKILITVGRLIKRKGVDWFTVNVMPRLDDDYIYLVAGSGPEEKDILDMIDKYSMTNRVKLLGKVSHDTLKLLYNAAHVMVLPNQKINDDPEGFGIVALESASCGLPVIANAVDGITEAVLEGRTGWLIDYNDIGSFVEKIKDPALENVVVRENSETFSWDNAIELYQKEINGF